MTTSVNPTKLHQELLAAGLPVVGVSSDGRVDYSRDLTTTEQTTAAAVIAAHNTAQTTEEVRIDAYLNGGIPLQNIVFALWYKIMQDDPTSADAIKVLMETINSKINQFFITCLSLNYLQSIYNSENNKDIYG